MNAMGGPLRMPARGRRDDGGITKLGRNTRWEHAHNGTDVNKIGTSLPFFAQPASHVHQLPRQARLVRPQQS